MAAEKLPWGLKSKGIAPGSMKTISENKLKAFNIGTMNIKKGVTKKEQEDMKKKREQEEAAEVYKEFVESFEESEKGVNRAWVKGGVVNPDTAGEAEADKPTSKLYKPTSKLLEKKSAGKVPSLLKPKDEEKPERPNKPNPTPQRLWTPTPVEVKKKSASEKKKTNLELFKEELKVIQTERQERKRVKQELGLEEEPGRKTRFDPPEAVASGISLGIKPLPAVEDYRSGSYTYDNDAVTTNLYLGNINPKMTEIQLCEIFGKYGPLASVKVMWPRSDEEKARGRNCGFVAYMNRKDGERALSALQGKVIMDFEMKLGWGKAVPIPPHPVYIPPALSELTLPPPPSGLPFNAQPIKLNVALSKAYGNVPPPLPGAAGDISNSSEGDASMPDDIEKTLANAVVKVVIPTERAVLNTVHRMIEFVVREGPMFEAMIMNREIQNPLFRFLFENQSPAHVYYRWKLFSILQGDTPFKWKTEEFRMFEDGSMWRPPQMNPYSQGMPDELVEGSSSHSAEEHGKKPGLTDGQRDRLEDMLRNLTPERTKVGDAMVWCLDHADSSEEVVECITESLSILQTPVPKKIGRLFLVSDILHNCSARVPHASSYRKMFESKLPEVFKDIHEAYEQIDARLKAEQFKQKVMACFRAWEDWAIYSSEYLINLQNLFLGLVATKDHGQLSPSNVKEEDIDGTVMDDVDGIPLEELDGTPLDGEPLKDKTDDDVNGVPLKSIVPYGDDIDGEPVELETEADKSEAAPVLSFAPSKWETVDESELEAQAITLSKWDLMERKRKEEEEAAGKQTSYDDIDGRPLDNDDSESGESQRSKEGSDWPASQDSASLSVDDDVTERVDDDSRQTAQQQRLEVNEAKRAKLREIEVKVMKYQDELEAGRRSRKPEFSIAEQVEQYRRKQLRKEDEKEREREKERRREEERERVKEWERARDRDRDRSRAVSARSKDTDVPDTRRPDARALDDRTSVESDRLRGTDSERGRDSDRRIRSDRNESSGDRSRQDDDRMRYHVDDDRTRNHGDEERSRRRAGEFDERRDDVQTTTHRDHTPASDDSRSDDDSSTRLTGSSLVNYPSSPPTSYRDTSSDSRHRRSRTSPKKTSRSGSPRKSRRSRSRSPGRHKHKKSRRS